MTKNIIIQTNNDAKAFQDNMNIINEELGNRVFATQTHITVVDIDILYTAVFFVRDEVKKSE
jgi:hypothetical protein